MQEYADPVIDWLDAGTGILTHRLFRDVRCPPLLVLHPSAFADHRRTAAQSCTQLPNGSYTKDLSIIEPDLSRVCLVDNSPVSYNINEGAFYATISAAKPHKVLITPFLCSHDPLHPSMRHILSPSASLLTPTPRTLFGSNAPHMVNCLRSTAYSERNPHRRMDKRPPRRSTARPPPCSGFTTIYLGRTTGSGTTDCGHISPSFPVIAPSPGFSPGRATRTQPSTHLAFDYTLFQFIFAFLAVRAFLSSSALANIPHLPLHLHPSSHIYHYTHSTAFPRAS
jgi:hypothetical protein